MALVDAWNKKSKEQVVVPEHWLGNPILGADLTAAPPEESSAPAEEKPASRGRDTKEK